jgi:hypothetical protein
MPTHWSELENQSEEVNNSVFCLNYQELLFGLIIGILLTLSYRHDVLSIPFHRYLIYSYEAFSTTQVELAQDFIWYFFVLGFLAAVSLIRFVRKQHHLVPFLGQISPIGYLTFAWPILLILPDVFISFNVYFFILSAGILLITIVLYSISKKHYDNSGDLLPILLNVASFLPFIFYTVRFWNLLREQPLW